MFQTVTDVLISSHISMRTYVAANAEGQFKVFFLLKNN